jgi:osmotically-inducible protein OsmY
MGKIRTLGIGAAIGGAGAYVVQRLSGSAERAGRAVGAQRYGMRGDVDDVTLAQKVESELYRDGGAPKGRISVNAADGVVQLRGEIEEPGLIEELVQRARSVDGVRDVENLLHLPGQHAPMHQ